MNAIARDGEAWRTSATTKTWHFPCRDCGTELVGGVDGNSASGPMCSTCWHRWRIMPNRPMWRGWARMRAAQATGALSVPV